jgi:hypothetical protein
MGKRKSKEVIDPTKNVLDLVAAETKRQDDLRGVEGAHIRELMGRDQLLAERMRVIETARLDAIRAVDQGQIQRAAEVSAQQATTLAAQTTNLAEAFRVSLAAALEPMQKDIADLRRVQYEQAGQKAQVVETRDVRGDQRLNINAVITLLGLLFVAAAFFLK